VPVLRWSREGAAASPDVDLSPQSGWYLPADGGGHVLVTEFRGMALNGLFCADVLQPLDLVPLTDFTYKYHLAPV